MKITAVATHKITIKDKNIFQILDRYIKLLKENSILVVTSKIVAICEGRVVKVGSIDKQKLIGQEADYYLLPSLSKYNMTLTIKNDLLIPTAGIDESNGHGYYILWPANPQKTANKIRQYLRRKFSLKNVGVIITDSRSYPLRLGTAGFSLAYSGFKALNSYINTPDIWGKKLRVTMANIADSLAIAAVLVMGEGKEQTPLAVIENIPFVKFKKSNPTKKELMELKVQLEDDLYEPLFKKVKWRKGLKRSDSNG